MHLIIIGVCKNMERITVKDIEGAFEFLCKIHDKGGSSYKKDDNGEHIRTSKGLVPNAGVWMIDHTYGGRVIDEMMEGGGVSQPFGSKRRNTREFYDFLHIMINYHFWMENNKKV